MKVLESCGKHKEAEEQRVKIKIFEKLKSSLIELITMDLEKPMQKMKDQAKLHG